MASQASPVTGSRSLLRVAAQYVPSVIIPAAANVALVAIFSRALGPAKMGAYYVALSVVTLGSILSGSWIQQSILRFESGTALERHQRFHLFVFACVPAVATTFFGLVFGLHVFASQKIPVSFVIAALVVTEAWFRLLLAILQSQSRPLLYSCATSAQSLGRLGAAYLLYANGLHDARCLFLGWLITQTCVCMFLFAALGYTRNRHRPDANTIAQQFRVYSAYGLPMLAFMLLSELRPFTDRMVLVHVLESTAVGIHGSNYALGTNSVGLMSMPLMLAVHPYLMTIANQSDFKPRVFRERTRELTQLFIHFCTLLVLAVIPASRFLSSLVLGRSFERGFDVLALATLGSVMSGLAIYFGKGLEARNRTGTMLRCNVIAYATSAGATVACVSAFGYVGASIGFAIGGATYAFIVWRATDVDLRPAFPTSALLLFGAVYGTSLMVPHLFGASMLTLVGSLIAASGALGYLYKRGHLQRVFAVAGSS